jgi:hypothetical protein
MTAGTSAAQVVDYDGLLFHPAGAGAADDVFTGEYHQVGDLVWADIAGPPVRMGRLVGTVAPDGTIDAGYAQVMDDGEVVSGRVVSRPTRLADGRIRLAEHWRRSDGSSGVSYIESES